MGPLLFQCHIYINSVYILGPVGRVLPFSFSTRNLSLCRLRRYQKYILGSRKLLAFSLFFFINSQSVTVVESCSPSRCGYR